MCFEGASFTFTKIADVAPFSGLTPFGPPAINEGGTVVFQGILAGPETTTNEGIFTGSGGALTTVVDVSSSPFSQFGNAPDINSEGVVAFSATRLFPTPVDGIFTSTQGTLTPIADSSDGSWMTFLGSPTINKLGTVAFSATTDRGEGIFLASPGGSTTSLIDSHTLGDRFQILRFPDVNNEETVVFYTLRAVSQTWVERLFISRRGTVEALAGADGRVLDGDYRGRPCLNNLGVVTFAAQGLFPERIEGVFTVGARPSNGEALAPIADTRGSFRYFLSMIGSALGPAINDRNRVAFQASLRSGGVGVFIGPDPVADKVIATGDTLFGLEVEQVFFSINGLNNSGQLAFWVLFANSTAAIVRAEPFL